MLYLHIVNIKDIKDCMWGAGHNIGLVDLPVVAAKMLSFYYPCCHHLPLYDVAVT